MTTKAQVQKLLKPISNKYPSFALHGRSIIATPVHHVVRYFLMDGFSVPNAFRPRWALIPLCVPSPILHISYSGRIGTVEYGIWDITKLDVQPFLIQQFEETVLPIFNTVQTLHSFKQFLETDPRLDHCCLRPDQSIILESALGNLDAARTIWTSELSKWTERHYLHFDGEPENMRRRQALGACLMADDRAGIAALLHEFEAFTVTSNKLEKIWERTPFPLETM
jgi:hypothetical protein